MNKELLVDANNVDNNSVKIYGAQMRARFKEQRDWVAEVSQKVANIEEGKTMCWNIKDFLMDKLFVTKNRERHLMFAVLAGSTPSENTEYLIQDERDNLAEKAVRLLEKSCTKKRGLRQVADWIKLRGKDYSKKELVENDFLKEWDELISEIEKKYPKIMDQEIDQAQINEFQKV